MKKTLIVIVVLLLIGVGLFLYFRSKSINTKAKAIKVIAAYTGQGEALYQSFDESYLISRAKAIKSSSDTFIDNDITYNTKTGKKV